MENSKNIFIKIDHFIFRKIDVFKRDGNFQKISELISTLEEGQQKIFAQVLTFSIIFIPYIFVIILFWGNHNIKKRVEAKNQILEQISLLNGNKDAQAMVSSNYLAPAAILEREDLDNKVRNIMSSSNIDQEKVNILNFNQIISTSNITKIEAALSFKNFGTQDFSHFMRSLVETERFKITRINLVKDKATSLLQGEVSLVHLGKNSSF
jgi:hypothetical protein